MIRTRLPNRRDSVRATLTVDGQEFTVGLSFDGHNRPKELFLDGLKEGSQITTILRDLAVVISVAVQTGVSPKALAKSVGRGTNGEAASVVGAALDFMVRMEPRRSTPTHE